jgi:hypothetical protein
VNTNQIDLPEFDPMTIIRDLGGGDVFRIGDALTGNIVFGATGSGKTSAVARFLALGYLAAGFGGIVLCSKPDESAQFAKWAAEAGREDDLVIIDAAGTWRFNFMECEASRPDEGGGLAINLVHILDEIGIAISGNIETGGGSSKFWEQSVHTTNTHLVNLVLLAGLQVSLPLLRSIVNTAAHTPEQVHDPEWRKDSTCAQIIAEADMATQKADPQVRADYEECFDFWMRDWPQISDKTRSIIELMLTSLIEPLVTRPLRKIFSSDTNIKPEDSFDGKIIVVNLPIAQYRIVGRIANLIFKFCFEMAVLRRVPPADRKSFLRPVFLWQDECQEFVTRFDSEYQAVARSAGGCTVMLSQNRESLKRVLKSDEVVDSLLGNLQAKWFCQNCGDTNQWAARLLGERWVPVTTTNASQSENNNIPMMTPQNAGHNAGVSIAEQRRFFVEPATFATLKHGGPRYGNQVECILYLGGHQFFDGREWLPYKFMTFNQS